MDKLGLFEPHYLSEKGKKMRVSLSWQSHSCLWYSCSENNWVLILLNYVIGEAFPAKADRQQKNWLFFLAKLLPLHSNLCWQKSLTTLLCVVLKPRIFLFLSFHSVIIFFLLVSAACNWGHSKIASPWLWSEKTSNKFVCYLSNSNDYQSSCYRGW